MMTVNGSLRLGGVLMNDEAVGEVGLCPITKEICYGARCQWASYDDNDLFMGCSVWLMAASLNKNY